VVDIVAVLVDQHEHKKAKSYWSTLKQRLQEEGSEVVTNCDQLKMQATDGKFYSTDAADTETIFRLVQSVPSPKAEPIKLWLSFQHGKLPKPNKLKVCPIMLKPASKAAQ